jgi:hypothetical protein
MAEAQQQPIKVAVETVARTLSAAAPSDDCVSNCGQRAMCCCSRGCKYMYYYILLIVCIAVSGSIVNGVLGFLGFYGVFLVGVGGLTFVALRRAGARAAAKESAKHAASVSDMKNTIAQ